MAQRLTPPARWLLGATGGLLLWASSFVVLYALLSLGCEAGWHTRPLAGTNLLTGVLVGAWLVHVLALATLWKWLGGWPQDGPQPRLARVLAAVALAATVWTGWPVLALPPCAGQVLAWKGTTCSRS